MKITIKAKGKDPENNEEELQKKQQLEELQRAEAEKELAAKAKQAQIDSLLEHFEKEAADSPELIKDKDSYFNSKEFNDLSNESFDFNKKRRAELEDRVVHLEDVYEQEKKKSKNTIPWRNYLVYLMIITSLSCCVTFSKYIATANGGSQGTIAKFDVELHILGSFDGEDLPDFSYEDTPTIDYGATTFKSGGDKQVYYFRVVNNSDVTVTADLVISGVSSHNVFCCTSETDETQKVTSLTLLPGESKPFCMHAYPASGMVKETMTFDVVVEQVD